jgi:hypothetical protein
MRLAVPALGILLVAAGAGAVALGLSVRVDPGPARAAARSALLGSSEPSLSAPARVTGRSGSGGRARYWQDLADVERTVSTPGASLPDRRQKLSRLIAGLKTNAARGAPEERSRTLSLLALARLAQSVLTADKTGQLSRTSGAVTALTAAVVLDPANEDAKANLELLLQAARSSGRGGRRNQATGTSHAGKPPPSQTGRSVAGGAPSTKRSRVGY